MMKKFNSEEEAKIYREGLMDKVKAIRDNMKTMNGLEKARAERSISNLMKERQEPVIIVS